MALLLSPNLNSTRTWRVVIHTPACTQNRSHSCNELTAYLSTVFLRQKGAHVALARVRRPQDRELARRTRLRRQKVRTWILHKLFQCLHRGHAVHFVQEAAKKRNHELLENMAVNEEGTSSNIVINTFYCIELNTCTDAYARVASQCSDVILVPLSGNNYFHSLKPFHDMTRVMKLMHAYAQAYLTANSGLPGILLPS